MVADVKALLKRAKALEAKPPVPDIDLTERPWQPTTGMDTNHQQDMQFHYKFWGIRGLNRYLHDRAVDVIEGPGKHDNSWVRLRDDFENNAAVAEYYLASLHPKTLEAIIDGTFMHKFYTDPIFRADVEPSTTLRDLPGVYLIWICQPESAGEHAGKGPSVSERYKISEYMSRYIDLSDTDFQDTAKEIDGTIWASNCQDRDYNTSRRYANSKNNQQNFDVIENYLQSIRRWYLDHADQHWADPDSGKFDAPMVRSSPYCGWGKLTKPRALVHEGQQIPGENALLGLYSAVIKLLYGDKFEFKAIQLFVCHHPRDADLLEILGHHISSSLVVDTGLNGAAPGGVGSNNNALTRPELKVVWRRARRHLRDYTDVADNLQATLDRINLTAHILRNLSKIEQDYKDTRARVTAVTKKVEEVADLIQAMDLAQKFETFQEASQEFRESMRFIQNNSDVDSVPSTSPPADSDADTTWSNESQAMLSHRVSCLDPQSQMKFWHRTAKIILPKDDRFYVVTNGC